MRVYIIICNGFFLLCLLIVQMMLSVSVVESKDTKCVSQRNVQNHHTVLALVVYEYCVYACLSICVSFVGNSGTGRPCILVLVYSTVVLDSGQCLCTRTMASLTIQYCTHLNVWQSCMSVFDLELIITSYV